MDWVTCTGNNTTGNRDYWAICTKRQQTIWEGRVAASLSIREFPPQKTRSAKLLREARSRSGFAQPDERGRMEVPDTSLPYGERNRICPAPAHTEGLHFFYRMRATISWEQSSTCWIYVSVDSGQLSISRHQDVKSVKATLTAPSSDELEQQADKSGP